MKHKSEPTVIFEDEYLLAINKPPGWVTNRADSAVGPTCQDWAEKYFQNDLQWQVSFQQDEVFRSRSGFAHRLDKDTSGVLLIAKSDKSLKSLMAAFKNRQMQKTYLALAHGCPKSTKGIISAAIIRHPRNRERFSVSVAGRPSQTHFEVLTQLNEINLDQLLKNSLGEKELSPQERKQAKKLYEDGFSLLQLQPKTGRTHQIRVHLQFIHQPIVGDQRYVGRKRGRIDYLWCQRQWLHAFKLEMDSPFGTQKNYSITAPVADDLKFVWRKLTQSALHRRNYKNDIFVE